LIGGPVPIVERVRDGTWASGAANFSVSDSGSLVYVPVGTTDQRTLVWVDRDGVEEPITAEPRAYAFARVSPDGTRVALEVWDQEYDVWVWELERETLTRLTSGRGVEGDPVWTPDGRRIVFSSTRDKGRSVYWKTADGSGAAEKLLEGVDLFPRSFTHDGEKLLIASNASLGDVIVFSLGGTAEPLLATEFDERSPSLSPNGRWLAYVSNATDRSEVYVCYRSPRSAVF
jgi:serine/threonine-protein kinase